MSERKRIRILVNGPLPPPLGGMATYCQDYMRTDLPTEFDIVFCRSVVLKSVVTARGVLRPVMRVLNASLITTIWIYLLATKRPHIAHIHTNSWMGFFLKSVLALLAKVAGAKTIMHVHGAEFKKFYAGMGRMRKRLTTSLLNANSRVVSLSEQWREFFESIGVHRERIRVMPNSVFVPEETVRSHGSKPCILFMSAFEPRKGIVDMIAALERQPEILQKCTVILAGPRSGLWQPIADRIERQPALQCVQMPGALTGGDKEQAYRRADCYILASYNEGMPIGLLEAMSHGLACITTPVGGIPEIIEHMHHGLLVNPGDIDGIAHAIDLLANDRGLRERLGAAARKTVQERYDWHARAKEIEQLYNELVKGAAGG